MPPGFRPPLARQLFEDRDNFNAALARYPQMASRVGWLRRISRDLTKNFEGELERLQEESENYPPGQQQLAAMRFYLRWILTECGDRWLEAARGATNYAELLERIDRWRLSKNEDVVLVTFNYDTLLERAANYALGYPHPVGQHPLPGYYEGLPHYKIIKPHGSVDWGREVQSSVATSSRYEDVEKALIAQAASLTFTGRFRSVGLSVVMDNSAYFPAIAIPVQSKTDFACPAQHITHLEGAVSSVNKLLVIGWRGSEEHFMKLLSGKLTERLPVQIVADTAGVSETEANLRKLGLVGDFRKSAEGFSGFLTDSDLEDFLG
jgi:hypothetical protein